jgi:hypothetical protein
MERRPSPAAPGLRHDSLCGVVHGIEVGQGEEEKGEEMNLIEDLQQETLKLKRELAQKDAIINGLITGQANALADNAALRKLCGEADEAMDGHIDNNDKLRLELRKVAGRGEGRDERA